MQIKLRYLLPIALAILLAGSVPRPAPAQAVELPAVAEAAAEITAPAADPAELSPLPMAQAEDQCLDCHTDKERLIQTADAVEEEPAESSGVG